jgi:alkylation response protein AidB-like acyl-CoA dehydrogenase
MDLTLTDDQAAVVELFSSFFARESSPAVVRASEALGFAPMLWARLQALGAGAISVGESFGGGGAGLLDAALAVEQAGRHLAPVPLVEHIVTSRLLERVGAADELAGVLERGDPVSLALRPVATTAHLLPGGAVVPTFAALTGERLVLVRSEAPGVPTPNGSGLAVADRSVVDGAPLARGASAVGAHSTAVDEWRLLTAAMLVGLADAALEIGVAYVSERHQFGVPIGSFQAIQHGLAEFPGPVSGARLLVARAAWRADHDENDRLPVDASMALLFATELARSVTSRVLHYHGGYGVMEEYDIQLHYRRARGWPAQLGDPAAELDRVARLLYGPSGGR